MIKQPFDYFSKIQKSALLHFLKAFVKKNTELSIAELLDKFIYDENYYFEVGNPHFEWLIPVLDEEYFLNDVKNFFKKTLFDLEQKEKQKPFLEMMKQKQKEEKKRQKDYILSKQPPTEKQLKYYKRLCEKYKIEQKETQNLSKLDLKNLIGEIIDERN